MQIENESSETRPNGRAKAFVAVSLLLALIAGLLMLQRARTPAPLGVASICPEAGTVPGLDADQQQLVDDAETLGCIGEPETTATSVGVPDPSTTTTPLSPPTTVSGVELQGSLGGLRATARIEPVDLEAAEIVTVHITADDDDGGELAIGVNWGDALGGVPGPSILECHGGEDVALPPSERTRTTRHAYRQTGRYPILVTVSAGYCDPDKGKILLLRGVITVGAGPLVSNGPFPPVVFASPADEQPAEAFALGITAEDPDGWIERIEIDWGDGSTVQTLEYSRSACVDDLKLYPGPTNQIEEIRHRFPNSGSYELNVKVYSAGCAGADVQQATTQVIVLAP